MLSTSDQDRLKQLAELIKKLRNAKGLSQSQLSLLARASVRSISGIESETIDHKVGTKLLIKLGLALDYDPQHFLKIMGYPTIGDEKILAAGKTLGLQAPGLSTPNEYFEELETRLSQQHAVLCITFLSEAGYADDRSIFLKLSNVINNPACDFWIAFVIPFPRPASIKPGEESPLTAYYQKIYGDIIEIVRSLLGYVKSDRRDRIAIFYPSETQPLFFTHPHLTTNLARSTFLKFYFEPGFIEDDIRSREMGVWGTTRADTKNHWFRMFPASDEVHANAADQLMKIWEVYLGRIVSGWNPTKDKTWPSELRSWKKLSLSNF